MAKKGKGSKKKQNKEDKKDSLPEVDKENYEIQIGDLNKKLTRVKQRCSELEKENNDIKKLYKTLEEETGDVIAYLKRSINTKQEEIQVVTDRLQALQATKATEEEKYQTKISSLEKEYKTMHDTFTAEVKLLSGQLSSLESFKNNRETLLKKMSSLEEELKKKDEEHALALRNNENKYLLMKEKLSGYLEERLLKLSLDLEKQNLCKVSKTTQNIIRENIEINNELNLIISSWQKLFDENELLKDKTKKQKQELLLVSELKDKAIEKNYVLNQILERLTKQQARIRDEYHIYKKTNAELNIKLEEKIVEVEEVRQTAQKKDALRKQIENELNCLKKELKQVKSENNKLGTIIKKAVVKIQNVIGLQKNKGDDVVAHEEEFATRRQLLSTLLDLFDTYNPFQDKHSELPCSTFTF